jgi:hypothetical protein
MFLVLGINRAELSFCDFDHRPDDNDAKSTSYQNPQLRAQPPITTEFESVLEKTRLASVSRQAGKVGYDS